MESYLVILIVVILLSMVRFTMVNNKREKLAEVNSCLLPCAFLCVIAGFRALDVGKDNYSYTRYFLGMTINKVYFFDFKKYWIYNLWVYLIRQVTDNVYVFNFLCALVLYISLYFFLHRYSSDERVSLILYINLGLFFTSMNQTRQALSLAVLLWAFHFVVQKKIVQVVILCLIATFVHNVAIVMLPVFLLFCLIPKITRSVATFFSIFSVGIVLLYNRLISLFVFIFPQYKYYLKYSKLFVERKSIFRYADFFLALTIQAFLLYGMHITRKKASVSTKRIDSDDIFGNILVCMNAIYLCMTYLILNGDIFNRLKSLFAYWVLLVIPYIIKKYFDDNKAIKALVCVVTIAYMWRLGVHDGDGVVPYKFYKDIQEILGNM
ncbi:polysaccharide biosynthesis protein [Butyrivibrio proteoclasticus B316]|uniref:Polysaccharide biosynthesis protein n=2 Tax=Butyrivibrio proteoclasticus TaxID=43305 RepID=E0S0Y2_BUTPB|nr:polysaccharide biosynthesis protein [Butyrivibrio proteoclasticus B316]